MQDGIRAALHQEATLFIPCLPGPVQRPHIFEQHGLFGRLTRMGGPADDSVPRPAGAENEVPRKRR